MLELVNSLSDQGLLPLQVALMLKQLNIALLLLQKGKANLNAYDLQVYNYILSDFNSK